MSLPLGRSDIYESGKIGTVQESEGWIYAVFVECSKSGGIMTPSKDLVTKLKL